MTENSIVQYIEPDGDNSLVTVSEAIKILGLSKSQFYKIASQKLNIYYRDNTPFYSITELQNLAHDRRKPNSTFIAPLVNDRQAAQVFRAFKLGSKPVEVVVDLDLHPTIVENLWIQYNRLNGAIIVDKDERQILEDIFSNYFPIHISSETRLSDMVVKLESAAIQKNYREVSPCATCHKERSYYCGNCAAERFAAQPTGKKGRPRKQRNVFKIDAAPIDIKE